MGINTNINKTIKQKLTNILLSHSGGQSDLKLHSNGHGEYSDAYKLTEQGIEEILSCLKCAIIEDHIEARPTYKKEYGNILEGEERREVKEMTKEQMDGLARWRREKGLS